MTLSSDLAKSVLFDKTVKDSYCHCKLKSDTIISVTCCQCANVRQTVLVMSFSKTQVDIGLGNKACDPSVQGSRTKRKCK